jgi:hypothetical protein
MTTRRLGIGLALAVSLFLLGSRSLRTSVAVAAEANKCGCYADTAGSCYCSKNAKCGCPGECEPKNCEAQRQKQFDREIQAETRRAAAAGRKSPEAAVPKDVEREKNSPRPMTGPQKRELARLLGLYLSERPNDRGTTAGDLLNELSHTDKPVPRSD